MEAPSYLPARCRERLNKEYASARRWNLWGTLSLSSVAAAAVVLLIVVVQNPTDDFKKAKSTETLSAQEQPIAKKIPRMAGQKMSEAGKKTSAGLKTLPQKYVTKHKDALPPLPRPKLEYVSVAGKKQRQTLSRAIIQPVSLAPAAARSRGEQAAPDYLLVAKPQLVRQTGEWSGDACAIRQPETLIAASPTELKSLWQRAKIQSVAIPAVNWKQQQVGAIFLGNKPGHGYEIRLKESQPKANQWVVKYHVIEPTQTENTMRSQPFLIFLLPKSKYQVVFTEE